MRFVVFYQTFTNIQKEMSVTSRGTSLKEHSKSVQELFNAWVPMPYPNGWTVILKFLAGQTNSLVSNNLVVALMTCSEDIAKISATTWQLKNALSDVKTLATMFATTWNLEEKTLTLNVEHGLVIAPKILVKTQQSSKWHHTTGNLHSIQVVVVLIN